MFEWKIVLGTDTVVMRAARIDVIDGTLFLYNQLNGIVFLAAPGTWSRVTRWS